MTRLNQLPLELLCLIARGLPSERDINAFVQNQNLYCLLHLFLFQHNIQFHQNSALLWAAILIWRQDYWMLRPISLHSRDRQRSHIPSIPETSTFRGPWNCETSAGNGCPSRRTRPAARHGEKLGGNCTLIGILLRQLTYERSRVHSRFF